jgi:hypothetical protein
MKDEEILRLIELLSEEARQTKRLANAAEKTALAAGKTADAAMKRADAAWEIVMITRNQTQDTLDRLNRPWWKKLLG